MGIFLDAWSLSFGPEIHKSIRGEVMDREHGSRFGLDTDIFEDDHECIIFYLIKI